MKFVISAVIFSLLQLLICTQSVEQKCLSSKDCGNSKSNQIISLFDSSENNVNLSVKWPNTSKNNSNPLGAITYMLGENLHGNISYNNEGPERILAEQAFLSTISMRLSLFSRPFNASRRPSASARCREHTKLFFKSLKNLELWALKLHDSSARLSSGVLNGNINQFGDFDQCLSVVGPKKDFQGQYCLAYLQPSISADTQYLNHLFDLVKAHEPFKSDFDDAGHRVPRYSLINWGLCIPSSCTPEDVEYSFKEYIRELTSGTGLSFQIRVEPRMCQISEPIKLDTSTIIVGGFFILVILFTLISTAYEYFTLEENQNGWLTAFSLYKNTKWLLNVETPPNDITAVHGIRLFNAVLLLISHKSLALFFNPYVNRTYMSEALGQSWTVIGRAASLYTDPFLLFSGMLTSYSLIGRLKKGQSIRLRNEYLGRLLRIVPTLGALILFCTFILPQLSTGPQWNLVVKHHSDLCKRNWWKNLLFIHNYFGFSDMCLTHTHHLGIDTQLFAIAPILILILWKWPKKGLCFLLFLAGIGTFAKYYTTVVYQLSNYIYFGTSIKRLFKTADYMYSSPPHRSTVYILGILLGYALRQYNGLTLSKNQLRFGWTFAFICILAAFFGPAPMGDINYKYNPVHAGFYAALAPIGWCSLFAWIVFVSHIGYTNKLTNLSSFRYFQISTKLSYSIYLTQFPVFFFNVGRRKHADYYSLLPQMIDLNEYICIVIASVVLTLLFDAPFQNIKKLILKTPPKTINVSNNNNNKNEISCDNNVKKTN